MIPDRPTLLVWSLITILVGASAVGVWMLAGQNADGLIALLERLEFRTEFRPKSTALVFVALFALTTALTLPTATLLCVASGYLFGTVTGAAVSITGALGGALITFVSVRFIAGERVRTFLMRGRARRLVHLLERDAFFYLIALRIVPVAPFFAINAAGAVIRISARRYLLATAIGLTPIVLIYASVGAGLDTLIEATRLDDQAMLLRPRIIVPLVALLAVLLLGILARTIFLRRRRSRGNQ